MKLKAVVKRIQTDEETNDKQERIAAIQFVNIDEKSKSIKQFKKEILIR